MNEEIENYTRSIGECILILADISKWVKFNVVSEPNQADIQGMAELAARLKYAAEVTNL